MNPFDLVRQIARFWTERTALASWSFVEPGASTPGNVYVPSLPPLRFRLAAAASLSLVESGAQPGDDPVRAFVVRAGCVAASQAGAIEIADDLREVLFPNGWPVVVPATDQRPDGVFGLPNAGVGVTEAWRILQIELEGGPTPTPGGRPDGLTGEGQHLATLTVRVRAHEETLS